MCAHFCADSPYSLAVGGKKNGFHVINVANMLPGMCTYFVNGEFSPFLIPGG